ncbi:MAG: YbbR-like domain-containing protein [Deltaproteobacteria bacterium]|nr:MAG: YbbR-like domain-containing protein [Deltaproteobacteria bacterium]
MGRRVARVVRWIFVDDLATKLLALLVALGLFVAVRNEVVKVVEIPVQYVPDPTRVVRSALPEHVEAVLRGPWGTLARLESERLPPLRVRLSDLAEGPLVLDPRGLVLPAGVRVERLRHRRVDVRFEPVAEVPIPIEARIVGVPAAGYRVVGARASPDEWFVRGPVSELEGIEHLWTEPVDVSGARHDLIAEVGLAPPPADVEFLSSRPGGVPVVRVSVRIAPSAIRRTVRIPNFDGRGELEVTVVGPPRAFEAVDDLEALLVVEPSADGDGHPRVRVTDEAPPEVRRALRVDAVRVLSGKPRADTSSRPTARDAGADGG